MERRFRIRQRQSPRPAVRTILVAGTASFILIGVVAAVMWQTFKEEPADAGLPKVVSRVSVLRPEGEVYKGTFAQPVLCIRIETTGDGKPPELREIAFSLSGTDPATRAILSNPRLFKTSGTGFNPDQPIKIQGVSNSDAGFTVKLDDPLEKSYHYFWLTFDIANKMPEANAFIIADCISITVGSLEYEPQAAATREGVKLVTYMTWYSAPSGDLSDLSSWNNQRDGSGSTPKTFAGDREVFFIQPGSVMTNKLNACLPNLVIESRGNLQSASAITALSITVESKGVWNQTAPFRSNASVTGFYLNDGGNYIHMNSGPVPGKQRTFKPASTVWFTDISGLDSTDQVWGNVVVDQKEHKSRIPSRVFRNITGSLEIRSGSLTFTGSDSISIGKDLLLSGGGLITTTSKCKTAISISRNLIIKDGCLTDMTTGNVSPGTTDIHIGNDIYISGGKLKLSASATLFPASDKWNASRWVQKGGDIATGSIILRPGTAMILEGTAFGPIQQESAFIVMHDARLDAGSTVIYGNGTFMLNKDAMLAIGHPEGIHSDAEKGNIQTRKRLFSSDADYVYNLTGKSQRTGMFTATPEKESVGVLRVFKNQDSDTLILERNFDVKKNYRIINGTVAVNGYRIRQPESAGSVINGQSGLSSR